MQELAPEVVADLKAKYPGQYLHQREFNVEGFIATVVIREPTAAEWRRYSDMADDDSRAPKLSGKMADDLVVYPEKDKFAELLARKPGLITKISAEVSTIAGAGKGVTVEKKQL